MTNPSDFKDYQFVVEPPESLEFEEAHPRRNILIPMVSGLLVILLVGGTIYAAIRPFLAPDEFDVVMTGVTLPQANTCDNVPSTSPASRLSPTRRICVCGRLFTLEEENVSYQVWVKNADGKTLAKAKFSDQRTGQFCHLVSAKSTLGEGRYIVEIRPNSRYPATAFIRFSIIDDTQRSV
jgi:hypothetical protein